jgi:hypothetical protein
VLYEHAALYQGAAPGGTLWLDRVALAVGAGDAKTEGVVYLGQTTAYGLHATRAGTLGVLATAREYAPWDFDLVIDVPLGKLLPGSSILTGPSEADAELALRYELPHAALRAGYRYTKVENFVRGMFFVGYSLHY